jgi:phage replication initiation protein
MHGYTHSFAFDQGGATFAFGGQRLTALVSLPGDACHLVPNWQRLADLGQRGLLGRITRWDGAADDFAGEHSVDLAAELFLDGAFNQGGRPPLPRHAGNWLTPDSKGRTFYVGARANGKLARIYEKGKQLGFPDSPWVRWEVELHNVDRVVPWDVLLAPDHFLSGAYPCMGWIGDQRSRIRTVREQDGIVYSRMREIASVAYGAFINVMLEREGSPERVVELLRKNGTPKRLTFSDSFLKHHAWRHDV